MEFLPENSCLLALERKIWRKGVFFVAGIDEVGRGPLAGPVVAAAVIFERGTPVPAGIDDSKKLTEKQRLELRERIRATQGVQIAIAEIAAEVIDEINILQAAHRAMREAISQLTDAEFALIDGLPVPGFPLDNEAVVKGDSKSASIAAASIIAKVYRDHLMEDLAEQYPEYGFERHKGYGTRDHLEALTRHGACDIHRKSFAPVRKALGIDPVQLELF